MRIIGIDPGTRKVGYGVLEVNAGRGRAVDYGVIKVPVKLHFSEKLCLIYDEISTLLKHFEPDAASIEETYVTQNAKTTLRLGHARGVIMLAVAQQKIDVFEYAPRSIKQAVLGNGAASKQQVQFMVSQLLRVPQSSLEEDAADGLAAALCHGMRKSF
ncbi:crossover junction endodeoxyribonuclease RuvC [bacterium]|nr:crossover junction endodeoxyribonuclease RuvC [bacterium]